jgi:hypothetical protein
VRETTVATTGRMRSFEEGGRNQGREEKNNGRHSEGVTGGKNAGREDKALNAVLNENEREGNFGIFCGIQA